MKKIGLISDTHGFIPPRLFDLFKDVDEIWHAGDIGTLNVIEKLSAFKPLKAVFGNIDDHQIRMECPEFLSFQVEQICVAMTHIAGKPGKYVAKAADFIEQTKPDIFVCGHSHLLLVQKDPYKNLLWLNPGACGNKGFHHMQTAIRFQIDGKKIEKMEVIEFGKRSSLHNED